MNDIYNMNDIYYIVFICNMNDIYYMNDIYHHCFYFKVENTKNMIKEAKSINLSLHYLEQVIITLRDQVITTSTTSSNASKGNNKSTYIPYRNSMLTNMLRDSLGKSIV